MVTPFAQVGYAGKSAITAMTSLGGASTTIDDVVWSAIVIPSCWLRGGIGAGPERAAVPGPARLSDGVGAARR